MFDVAVIGYGPVSEVLALVLGRQGRRVAVFERWRERYSLPRAVCVDHEMFRMLSAIGLRDQLPAVSHSAPPYRWFSAEWRELLHIDWSLPSLSGGSEVNFVHQPTLEEMFDRAVRQEPTVEINLGFEAVAIDEHVDHVAVTVRDVAGGGERQVRARYLVGADGANSLVRRTIGGAQEDFGFEADWLVIDILPHEGVELDVPPAAQWCNPARPTTIVPAGIRDGRRYRRWEFMRLPGETVADIENEQRAWELLRPWVRPDQATMVRHKVYNFRSLLAERWHRGRLLIAGDAAHVMPPFMGQGMCAGLRDDWNLAWKLALVLDGRADPKLLDTYTCERRPHVTRVIEMSMYLGRLICVPDPQAAAARDRAFLDGTAPPPPEFPHLTDGLLDRAGDGSPAPAAGLLSPHGVVRFRGRTGRFDDLVGIGFTLLLRAAPDPSLRAAMRAADRSGLLGDRLLHFAGPESGTIGDADAVGDLDGRFEAFMDRHGLASMLVRPDFYLFGAAARPDATPALLRRFASVLGEAGVAAPAFADPGLEPFAGATARRSPENVACPHP